MSAQGMEHLVRLLTLCATRSLTMYTIEHDM